MIQNLNIDGTDVILQDYEFGKGKIIISDNQYDYNFSYHWGAMSDTLKDFLLRINEDYFVKNLTTVTRGRFDSKTTMKNVRHWWKKESGIAWYEYKEEQKTLRQELRFIENICSDDQYFVERMGRIKDSFYFPTPRNYNFTEHKFDICLKSDFELAIEALASEPWHHIVYKEPYENIWLSKFFPKLQKELKKI